MPGIAELIDGAMQQAPHPARHPSALPWDIWAAGSLIGVQSLIARRGFLPGAHFQYGFSAGSLADALEGLNTDMAERSILM